MTLPEGTRRVGGFEVVQSTTSFETALPEGSQHVGRARKPRYTEQASFSKDRNRPYFNIFVRDSFIHEKIHHNEIYYPGTHRVRFVDIWKSPDDTGVTRQGDREGSSERANYPIPCRDAFYHNFQDGQLTVHSHSYKDEQNHEVLRIEIPYCMEMIAENPELNQ
jgi:hypothetical protein